MKKHVNYLKLFSLILLTPSICLADNAPADTAYLCVTYDKYEAQTFACVKQHEITGNGSLDIAICEKKFGEGWGSRGSFSTNIYWASSSNEQGNGLVLCPKECVKVAAEHDSFKCLTPDTLN